MIKLLSVISVFYTGVWIDKLESNKFLYQKEA